MGKHLWRWDGEMYAKPTCGPNVGLSLSKSSALLQKSICTYPISLQKELYDNHHVHLIAWCNLYFFHFLFCIIRFLFATCSGPAQVARPSCQRLHGRTMRALSHRTLLALPKSMMIDQVGGSRKWMICATKRST